MGRAQRKPFTLEDFLAWERDLDERHEFVDGIIRMMVGGTNNHSRISLNVAMALGRRLGDGPCQVFAEGPMVVNGADAMYPDVVVTCSPVSLEERILPAPVVVVEVLSRSTRRFDLEHKNAAYQTIPSVRHVVFVDHEKPRIDVYDRIGDGEEFAHRTLDDHTAPVALPALGVEIPFAEVYRGSAVRPPGEW
jgi:Uma2 family endonuclease